MGVRTVRILSWFLRHSFRYHNLVYGLALGLVLQMFLFSHSGFDLFDFLEKAGLSGQHAVRLSGRPHSRVALDDNGGHIQ